MPATLRIDGGLWLDDDAGPRKLARDGLGIVDAAFVDECRFVLAYPEQLLLCELTRLGFTVLHRRRHAGGALNDGLALGMVRAFAAAERWPNDYTSRKRAALRAKKAGDPVFVPAKPTTAPSPYLSESETVALGLSRNDAAWRGESGRTYAMARGSAGCGLEHVVGSERRPIELPRKRPDVLADALALTSISDEPDADTALVLHAERLYRFFPDEHRLEALPRFDYGAFDHPPWRVRCLADGRYALQSLFATSIRAADHTVVHHESGEPAGGFATEANAGPVTAAIGRFGELAVVVTTTLKTRYDGCGVRLARAVATGLQEVLRVELPLYAPSVVVADEALWIVDPLHNGFRLDNADGLPL